MPDPSDPRTWEPTKLEFVTKKKMVRVVLSSTSYIDFEAPEGFSMLAFVTNIRASGHWLNEHLYVPASEIRGVFLWQGDTPPVEGNIIPFKPGV